MLPKEIDKLIIKNLDDELININSVKYYYPDSSEFMKHFGEQNDYLWFCSHKLEPKDAIQLFSRGRVALRVYMESDIIKLTFKQVIKYGRYE